ncbi:MAG: PIN domain nuclease [Candidatus Rokubacteria bacterium]|nr:PIN domain nuclease [Candidatus Rokubacteria bacterium]
MILVDTSAWIELLRGSGHPAHVTLRHHLQRRAPVATTEPIIMELLAGTRSAREHSRLRARLLALPRLSVRGLADFEAAAELYRTCRGRGATVRKLIDCLIAAVAIREHATVLHNDRDFEVIARHTRLRVERYRTLRPLPSR